MFNPIARIVVRDEGPDNPASLLIGTMFKGQRFFKPGFVYTVREILGEVHIKEEGESVVAKSGENYNDAPIPGLTWAHQIGDVVADGGRYLWLTRKELAQHMESLNDRD